MSRQEKLDTNAKAIQQTELVAQLKKTDNNGNAKNAGIMSNLCFF